ncbi:rhodanese-like domain-containing protein [Pseudaestuariivita atlantica]|nr:rhodanese-like domain-containing protein [Pseudaestuariivita atlantica]
MSVLTRRNLMLAAGAAAAGGFAVWTLQPEFEGAEMTPEEAHAAASSGDILLIDIRRPDEWKLTGVGAGAAPLDMRRDDFVAALTALAEGDTARPIALICARGVRSARMSRRLEQAGFTRIIDVPEGMLGSRAGPGWLKRGLPVVEG